MEGERGGREGGREERRGKRFIPQENDAICERNGGREGREGRIYKTYLLIQVVSRLRRGPIQKTSVPIIKESQMHRQQPITPLLISIINKWCNSFQDSTKGIFIKSTRRRQPKLSYKCNTGV